MQYELLPRGAAETINQLLFWDRKLSANSLGRHPKSVTLLLPISIVILPNRRVEASISYRLASSDVMHVPSTTKTKAVFVAFLAAFLMSAEWILLVAGVRLHEMIVGSASVLVSGAFLFSVHRHSAFQTDFHFSDLAMGWRIPWYVVSDLFVITLVLFKDIFGIEKAKSLFRVAGFKAAKKDPVLVARQVLAIAYTSASPNTIVLGIDYTSNRMLFHQLKGSPLPKMTENLGAKS